MKIKNIAIFLVIAILIAISLPSTAAAQSPVVKAVFFHSPYCAHCLETIEKVIPGIQKQYGDQLQILMVDTTLPQGENLYQNYFEAFSIPNERAGVPAIIVGNNVMVGSVEIPAQFPGLIEAGLANGGQDWPVIPGLDDYRNGSEAIFFTEFHQATLSIPEKFSQDIIGNSLAVLILLAMIASFYYLLDLNASNKTSPINWPSWLIPVLLVIGLVAAAYLSYVELTSSNAVCGPVGDCNTVQQSRYSVIFGIPVGVIGVLGYLTIALAWIGFLKGNIDQKKFTSKAMWWMAGGGVLFSIYLTFLEPFVIGATCIWCLTSAVVMTMLFWVFTPIYMDTKKIKKPRRKKSRG